jgi:DNA (cytosine-5)-methyltransferase 1
MHNNNSIVPYISLCSGYEGIGLGLHRCIQNLRCIGYCEREAFAISNLVAKMENGLLDAAPVFTDVTTFPWRDYAPFMAGGILSFGWPCQPVSTAGKRKATEDERWLFDIIADGISIMRPGILFAENVEGLLSAKMPDGSSVFGHCIERLESLHYKVEAGIFSASEVGAVHQRKRVFIMAHSSNEGLQGGKWFWQAGAQGSSCGHATECSSNTWPSRPGQPQYAWEPPRVVGNTTSKRSCGGSEDGTNQQPEMLGSGHEAVGDCDSLNRSASPERWQHDSEVGSTSEWKAKPKMGRDIDGITDGMDIAELSGLCHSELEEIRDWMVKGDNRTDELRSCGNGVVPATAERAFRILMEELINK